MKVKKTILTNFDMECFHRPKPTCCGSVVLEAVLHWHHQISALVLRHLDLPLSGGCRGPSVDVYRELYQKLHIWDLVNPLANKCTHERTVSQTNPSVRLNLSVYTFTWILVET